MTLRQALNALGDSSDFSIFDTLCYRNFGKLDATIKSSKLFSSKSTKRFEDMKTKEHAEAMAIIAGVLVESFNSQRLDFFGDFEFEKAQRYFNRKPFKLENRDQRVLKKAFDRWQKKLATAFEMFRDLGSTEDLDED